MGGCPPNSALTVGRGDVGRVREERKGVARQGDRRSERSERTTEKPSG